MISELIQSLTALKQAALKEADLLADKKEAQAFRVKYTGKKGAVTNISKEMRQLPAEDKPQLGKALQDFYEAIDDRLQEVEDRISQEALKAQLDAQQLDVSLPGRKYTMGYTHLLTQTREAIENIFLGMGYQIIDGPQVEYDSYNFERMNIPKNHPARDMQDTFYISDDILLRTHTSPVQARTMEAHDFSKGPLRMISPGIVFRRDSDDATHSHQFQQVEGLVVDTQVKLSDLKGSLLDFSKGIFGEDRDIRLRPSYFPFTEPSVEIDVSCFKCGGQGCSVCKQTGWIEILGGGMVHPRVLAMSGIDPDKYSAFAFGVGIERIAMLKYAVDDIRNFYQNDMRFISQFKGGH